MSGHHAAFRRMIEEAELTQQEVADLLAKATGDAVSLRTVKSWLANPALSSARPCPGWAVKLLGQALAQKRGKRKIKHE